MSVPVAAADHPLVSNRMEFVQALRARDVNAACAMYADDAALFPPLASALHGRSEISRYWQAGIDAGMSDITLDSAGLFEREGIAYDVGRYTLRIEPSDGRPVVEHGHYVQIHELIGDGSWQRTVEIFAPGGDE